MANLKFDLDSVESNAEVVQLEELGNGVVQITMKDEEKNNGFSQELIVGLSQHFQAVSQNKTYKVVILAGTSHYFATGVTGEDLMSTIRGESNFTPENAFNLLSLALNCPIPVISAMEGHALGGGFALGLYADFLVLSQESFYASNFMKYGFIPGAGAIFILLKKLGSQLGQEMTYTARNYRGEELAKRGVPFPVLPKKEVLEFAKKIANEMAEKPRLSLVTLKKYLISETRKQLPEVLQKELEMQQITFYEAEVKTRIKSKFTEGNSLKLPHYNHNQLSEAENVLLQLQSGEASLEDAEELLLETIGKLQTKAIKNEERDNDKNNLVYAGKSEEILSLLKAEKISLESAEKLLLEVVEPSLKTEIDGLSLVQKPEQISYQKEIHQLQFTEGNSLKLPHYNHNQLSEAENILLQLQSGEASLEDAEELLLETIGKLQTKAIKNEEIDNDKNNLVYAGKSEEILSLLKAEKISLENAEKLLLEVVEPSLKTEIDGLSLVQKQEQISHQEKILHQLQLGEVSLEAAEGLLLKNIREKIQEKAVDEKLSYGQKKLINPDSSEEILSLRSTKKTYLGNTNSLLLKIVEPEPKIKIDSPTAVHNTDIAIIGMSCRYPGAKNWQQFWENLKNGVDSVTEVPLGRWEEKNWYHPDPEHQGTSYSKSAGFLDEIDKFDPLFFQISPGEAQFIEPQQRIFLEEAYHAIEDAGYAADSLKGKQCGVFVGAATNGDYSKLLSISGLGTHRMALSGNLLSIVPARIAYFLDLRGPVLAVDTACSSSLVAVHQACESIQRGESELAIAGGIATMATADFQVLSSQFKMLSATGRCNAFDASASGTVWSEGCGVVFLKSYNQAIRDNDHVYGVIKGTSINYDGNTNGISAPSSQSQTRLEEAVYRKFGINPETISYVEAHGTATPLGDPIEVEALTKAFSKWTNKKQFCAIGSVKTNIGHPASAAGVAGLIKTILCLKNEKLVPSLHFNQPNPHIDFENSPFYVNTEFKDWQVLDGKPRRAALSSFGFSGTNAHLVIEEASLPVKDQNSKVKTENKLERSLHLLTLSAKCEKALQELAQSYHQFLNNNSTALIADICFTANTGRSHFDHRLALVAESREKLLQQLKAFETGDKIAGLLRGQVTSQKHPKIAFLFTSQGSQYVDMARELYSTQSLFRKTLEECDRVLRLYLDKSLLNILYPQPGENSLIDETAYTQPALFAIEYALAQLWQSWGIKPDVVMGHSVGEYVAATIAGVFSLEDGLKLIAHRGRLMQQLASGSEMVSVMASLEKVNQLIAPYAPYIGKVALAAINGTESVVISGEVEALTMVRDSLESQGIKTKQLQVSQSFHSPLIEPMLAEFEAVASEITYNKPCIPIISNLTGQQANEDISTPQYWVNHLLKPVKFVSEMKSFEQIGYELVLEIGAKPILLRMGRQCLTENMGVCLPTLHPSCGEWQQMLQILGELYVTGFAVNWSEFDQDYSRNKVVLPTYPFQRQRYWIETSKNESQKVAYSSLEILEPQLGVLPVELSVFQQQSSVGNQLPKAVSLWESAVSAGLHQAQQCPLDLALHKHSAQQECLERLAIAYIVETLSSFGIYTKTNEKYSPDRIVGEFGISLTYCKLISKWLKKLANFGLLRQQEEIFVCDYPLPTSQLGPILSEAKELFQDTPFLLEYLQNCGKHLPDILTGKQSPLETLFPKGSLELAENLYQKWAVPRYFNEIVRSVFASVVKAFPSGKQMQILEIGAGTGGTTASVLPVLPLTNSIYCFTDLSDFFFVRAKDKFKAYPFVHYGLLDIEQDPQNFGYSYKTCDVIVAANVLHATRNLEKTLENVLSLLAPGGLLILNEVTHDASWFDISTGLIEGWQGFEDQLRQDSPLLSRKQWEETLYNSGFEKVMSFPEHGSIAEILGQNVIVAQAPGFPVNQEGHTVLSAKPATGFSTSPVVLQKTESSLTWESLLAASSEKRQQTLESYVSEQVAKVLGLSTSKLDVEKPLNYMGLDSLMSLDIKNRIEVNLGVVVPTATFFQDISIRQLTMQVLEQLGAIPSFEVSQHPLPENTAKNSDSKAVSLIKIQPNGSKPPFVCIHPGGLDVSCYTNLVQHLSNEQPFYVLQPLEFNYYQKFNDEQLSSSIEDIASRCIEILHTIQPQSPYFLGGWSLGGSVAFEVAQQLRKQGHEVAFLALLDVVNPPVDDDFTLLSWFASYLGVRHNKELQLSYDKVCGFDLDGQLNYLLQQAIVADIVPISTNHSEFRYLFQAYKIGVQTSLQKTQKYTPQIYPFCITLFQTHEDLNDLNGVVSEFKFDRKNWSSLSTQPLDFHVVPGNHYTMFIEPHVQILAEKLTSCLNAIEIPEKQ